MRFGYILSIVLLVLGAFMLGVATGGMIEDYRVQCGGFGQCFDNKIAGR